MKFADPPASLTGNMATYFGVYNEVSPALLDFGTFTIMASFSFKKK